jgi:Raf kinase inhibitor-like YbhB/YbcL family protein
MCWIRFGACAVLAAWCLACGGGAPPGRAQLTQGAAAMTLSLTTTAFATNGPIPARYTCDGEDRSPPLTWSDAPAGAAAFALIMDDPDAPRGVFTHWVLYNLPRDARELSEGVPGVERLPSGALQGVNDFGRVGYGGPCPPPGPAHRYRFTLYALDTALNLGPRATKQAVLDAMRGHVLAEGQLIGTYQRQRR